MSRSQPVFEDEKRKSKDQVWVEGSRRSRAGAAEVSSRCYAASSDEGTCVDSRGTVNPCSEGVVLINLKACIHAPTPNIRMSEQADGQKHLFQGSSPSKDLRG